MSKTFDIKIYGLSDRFTNLLGDFEGLAVSRITSQEKGLYRVVSNYGEKFAEVSGKFRYNTLTVSDYPAVGDFTMVNWNENGGNAIFIMYCPEKAVLPAKQLVMPVRSRLLLPILTLCFCVCHLITTLICVVWNGIFPLHGIAELFL